MGQADTVAKTMRARIVLSGDDWRREGTGLGKTFINIVETDVPDITAASTYAPFFEETTVIPVTTSNLDSTVTGATAVIYSDWDGTFNLSHGPCGPPETTVPPETAPPETAPPPPPGPAAAPAPPPGPAVRAPSAAVAVAGAPRVTG